MVKQSESLFLCFFMRVRRSLEISVVNERSLKISRKCDCKIKCLLLYQFSRMSRPMSKLSSVIVMEGTSLSASPVRDDFKYCSFGFLAISRCNAQLLQASR